jgi:ribose transport system substrate-binding protein
MRAWFTALVATTTFAALIQIQGASAEENGLKCTKALTVQEMAGFKAPKASKKYEISLQLVSLGAHFFQAVAYGATKAAEDAHVNLTVSAGQGFQSQAQQLTQVENALARKVDAIVLNPVDVNGSIRAVELARDKGVPVIDVGTIVNTPLAPKIVQDDFAGGVAAAEFVAKSLPNGGEGILMGGPQNATWASDRTKGFLFAIKKHSGIKVNAVTHQDINPSEGLAKFTNAVQAHPKVDWIYATFNLLLPPTAIPAEYSKALYIAATYDPVMRTAIRDGKAAAVIPDFPVWLGYMGVSYAVTKLDGGKLPELTCIPNIIVTKKEVEEGALDPGNFFPEGWKASGH